MNNYKYTKVEPTQFDNGMIIRESANGEIWYIPTDPANSDYQAYLAAQFTPIDTEDE
jgi:hypothetical protein